MKKNEVMNRFTIQDRHVKLLCLCNEAARCFVSPKSLSFLRFLRCDWTVLVAVSCPEDEHWLQSLLTCVDPDEVPGTCTDS